MKHYKVITDELEWMGVPKGFEFNIEEFNAISIPLNWDEAQVLRLAFNTKPEWFKEITEQRNDERKFTKDEMERFGKFCSTLSRRNRKRSIDFLLYYWDTYRF